MSNILALAEATAARGRALAGEHWTDLGNAERFVAGHGRDLRYVHAWRVWFYWDGTRWVKDEGGETMRRAGATVRGMYADIAKIPDEADRRTLANWLSKSESEQRLHAMVNLAASILPMPVMVDELDSDPWVVNVLNGVIDLKTGALLQHKREYLLTMLAPVKYDVNAVCPAWDAFITEIFNNNTELIAFVQRLLGLALIGKVIEHVLTIFFGTGANGKTTLVNAVLGVMGDYGYQAEPELLLARRGEVHPTNVAGLLGRRFVVTSEIDQGRRLAEAAVKQLTGGDRRTARFMRQDFFEFEASDTIVMLTNHKPVIRGTDGAIWRRIRLVPFDVTIPAEKQDPRFGERLRAEAPGILRWLVEGCLAYQRDGLGMPDAVRTATASYRSEQDVFAAFLEDRCQTHEHGWVATSALWAAYQEWCTENGERSMTKRSLTTALEERGFAPERGRSRPQARGWRGVLLQSPVDVVDGVDA